MTETYSTSIGEMINGPGPDYYFDHLCEVCGIKNKWFNISMKNWIVTWTVKSKYINKYKELQNLIKNTIQSLLDSKRLYYAIC